jgi:hypothetical protein
MSGFSGTLLWLSWRESECGGRGGEGWGRGGQRRRYFHYAMTLRYFKGRAWHRARLTQPNPTITY